MLVAIFAFLPFKTVAKLTILFAAAVFILQPFPLARLYALIAVLVVQFLVKQHRKMEESQQADGRTMTFLDTHVHLWQADSLPPWLIGDPTLAPIAIERSIDDFVRDAGGPDRLDRCVYMEVITAIKPETYLPCCYRLLMPRVRV